MQFPLISIIIPTYNSAKTISIALDSICYQTFKNWEILVIDSLSTDATIAIVNKYRSQFSQIKIYSERDDGIYEAMNKGIELAQGDWIYFMGSDDNLYKNNSLENIVKIDDLDSYDVIYGNVYSSRFYGVFDGKFTFFKLLSYNMCHQAIFLKKSVFKEIGKFNLKYRSHADWDHNIKWFFNSKIKKLYIDSIIANYADGGFSSENYDLKFENARLWIIWYMGLGKIPVKELLAMSRQILNRKNKMEQ